MTLRERHLERAAAGSTNDVLLSIRDLSVTFVTDESRVEAVKHLSFDIRRGETVALVGESGSGKSVSSLAIMGLLPNDIAKVESGQIIYNERDKQQVDLLKLNSAGLRRIRGNEIAMIFQEPMTSLNPVYTIGDQIAEAVILHQNKSRSEALEIAAEMLEKVEIPNARKRLNDYPHQLSGGMRQRVMIAMALSCNPALLIADEPTTALDVIVQAQILDLMRKLQEEIGTSILFITHDLGVVAEMANRVVVMEKGLQVETQDVGPLFAHPQQDYTKRLLAAVPRIDQSRSAPDVEQRQVLVRSEGLEVHFPIKGGFWGRTIGHVKAVDGVTFNVHQGEILGLVGESGSGKTTAGRAILQLIKPTGGHVFYGTENPVDLTTLGKREMREMRRKMQIIYQDPFASLDPRMTIEEILAEPLDIHGLYKGPERQPRIASLLDMVQLPRTVMSRYPHEFSGGQRQRIGIARTLALDPKFVVADECVSALDVSIQAEVLELLRKLKAELNLTMLFISHDLAVVEEISDRVAVMFRGKLVEVAGAHELYRNPKDDYTKALLSAIPIPDPTFQRQRVPWDSDAYQARMNAQKGAI